jgi:hypothetical protein
MKNIKLFILCICVALKFSSCDLDSTVYSSLTEDNFPKTEEDAESLLTGLYGNVKNNSGGVNDGANGGWGWPLLSISAEAWTGFSMATTDEMYTVGSANIRDFEWGNAFNTMNTFRINKNITRATYLISVIEKTDGIREDSKQRMIAEAKCIRAWIMFALYDLYGPIPYIVDPDKAIEEIKYEPRPSKEEYFNQMVKDFTEAIPYLYDKTNNTANWGRVNKGLANMLLMKLYMNDHQYEKALPFAEAVTKMGYKLEDDYFAVFSNEGNNEVIWAVPSGARADNEWFFYTIPSDCAEVLGQEVAPYWGVFVLPWDFYDTFTDQDIRKNGLAESYIGPDGKEHSRTVNPTRSQYGAIVVKYFLPKSLTSSGNYQQVSLRYADVILSLAEIENTLNGPTERALGYLKQITDRAGTTSTIPNNIQQSKETFNDFLLAERGRELHLEGWRRQDLLRFGKYISNARERGKNAKDHQVLLPIPPQIIIESGGIITQNPGYE